MKNFIIAATSIFCLSQQVNAQQKRTTIQVPGNQAFTKTGMVFNKGDTIYLSATGSVSVGPMVTARLGKVGPCGYEKPSEGTDAQYEEFNNKYNRKNASGQLLPHHGALIVFALSDGQVNTAKELCSLPDNSKNPDQKIIVFKENNLELAFGQNDNDPGNNVGSFAVTIETPGKSQLNPGRSRLDNDKFHYALK